MTRYALVRNGATEGVILWDGTSPYTPPPGATLVPEAEAPPPAPEPLPPVPPEIPLIQLLLALTILEFISEAEALAAAQTGALPASLEAQLFAAVTDPDAQFLIRLHWAGMYAAERSNEFWGYVVAAGIATEAQIDQVFRVGGGQA
jgi:hypothetical protein